MDSIKSKVSNFFNSASKKFSNLSRNQKIVVGSFSAYFLYKFMKSSTKKPKNLNNEIVFITGAASGIGKQLAYLLAKEGAKVVIVDINKDMAEKVADSLTADGFQAIAIECDVTSLESVKIASNRVRNHFGDPTILINNAGIVSGKAITEIPIESVERTFKVNVISHFYTIKEFLPKMIENDKGHIVTIASLAGIVGLNRLTDYSASKFAAVGLDESLRNELNAQGSNVKTTCINPFYVNTGMFDGVKTAIPMLKEDFVARRILEAIKFDEKVVTIPNSLNYIYVLRALLSVDNFDRYLKGSRAYEPMKTFKGRN
ncbi:hypothetical protein SteCoe_10798 [Stentor coeruleus]|uniref:Short-chain dehydrogenase/reductase 3 n=1 Tax=Stentor coeruleus TaxID=5963 RepID=A0A1R2CEL2_9CILI|nr:hypothetical protein SteCoe_10798 [Stentor coeruleus]